MLCYQDWLPWQQIPATKATDIWYHNEYMCYQVNVDMSAGTRYHRRQTWDDTGTLPRQHGCVTKTTACSQDNSTWHHRKNRHGWHIYVTRQHTILKLQDLISRQHGMLPKHTSQEERFQMTQVNRSFTYTSIETITNVSTHTIHTHTHTHTHTHHTYIHTYILAHNIYTHITYTHTYIHTHNSYTRTHYIDTHMHTHTHSLQALWTSTEPAWFLAVHVPLLHVSATCSPCWLACRRGFAMLQAQQSAPWCPGYEAGWRELGWHQFCLCVGWAIIHEISERSTVSVTVTV